MKTMTCRQMGGPCDAAFSGDSADDVIKAQDQHLKDAVAVGDATHRDAADGMAARWKKPISGMRWYRDTRRRSPRFRTHERRRLIGLRPGIAAR
ncbi:MAG: DUF1059 domain-containing protein [Actinobacteria bacterium]|nr:DUF1059 domain-containing protein [Actinomycetota bacterium]